MRWRIIWGAAAVVLAVGTWWTLDRFEIINPPTEEMRSIRAVEEQLQLPVAYQRTEHDEGCYQDWKGATQCRRDIFFFYEHNDYWPALRSRLDELSWPSYEPAATSGTTYFRAWNGDEDRPVCLSHHADDDSSAIFISGPTDDGCRHVLEVLRR